MVVSIVTIAVSQSTIFQTSNAASALIVPTYFPTIQAAINAASSSNMIKVLPGIYTEQLTIGKNLILVGSGAKSTIIKAPAGVQPSEILEGKANIIELSNNAKVTMKGFTIAGPDGSNCDNLFGVTIADGAALKLDSSAVKGCTIRAITVGFCGLCFPTGPQVGHATIINTEITNYRENGIQSGGDGSTISVSNSKVIAANAPEIPGQVGILFGQGVRAAIDHNKISGNICGHPACGPDFFNQIQSAAILALQAIPDSTIFQNEVTNNDVGIGVFSDDRCCKISQNKLEDNQFFGMSFLDGVYTSLQDKISGGNIGVAAIGISTNTKVTLVNDKITSTTAPTQELSCCGGTAEIVTVPPGGFKVSVSQANVKSSQVHDLMEKKFKKLMEP